MELIIKVRTDSAAFGESSHEMVEEILRVLNYHTLEKVCAQDTAGVTLRDSNGNTVGTMVAVW